MKTPFFKFGHKKWYRDHAQYAPVQLNIYDWICEVNQITNLVSGGRFTASSSFVHYDIHESIIAHLEIMSRGWVSLSF